MADRSIYNSVVNWFELQSIQKQNNIFITLFCRGVLLSMWSVVQEEIQDSNLATFTHGITVNDTWWYSGSE